MEKFLSIYKNWRNDVLFAVFAATLFLLFCDSESMIAFAISKLMAIVGFVSFCALYRYWDAKGEINELSDMAKEED